MKDFEGKTRLTGPNGGYCWTTHSMGPIIKDDVFEFEMKIHTRTDVMLGVIKPGHSVQSAYLDQTGKGYGWGMHFKTNNYDIRISKGNGEGHEGTKDGDTFRFVVDKEKNTIHAQVNNGKLVLIISKKNCEGFQLPSELQIACSRYNNQHQDVEIISFKGTPATPDIDLEELEREENERLDSIIESFGDIKIPLQNKELNLWKCFLINSKIPDLFNKPEYRGLSDLNLNVDEKKILLSILGKNADFKDDELIDYYVFFQRLGMKREMKIIIDQVMKMKDLVQVYEHLQRISSYEDEAIKSWFSSDSMKGQISEFRENTFRTSYCLILFNILKDNFSAVQTDSQFFMKFAITIGFVMSHLLAYKTILDPLKHPDFSEVNFDCLKVSKFFSDLYEKDETANVKLRTNESEDFFFCHREVLVYRLGHFKRMFEFDGREREALLNNESGGDLPVVIIEDMSSDCLQALLEFIYLGYISEDTKVSILVYLCILSQKYIAPKLKKNVVDNMYKQIKIQKYSSEEDIIEILRGYSQLLFGNAEICELVFPCLGSWSGGSFSVEKMKKTVRKGYDSFQLHSKLQKFEELENRVTKLEEENEKLKKVIKEKLGVDID